MINTLLYLFRLIWTAYFSTMFSIAFLLLYPFIYLFLLSPKGYPLVFSMKRFVAYFSIIASGIILSVKREGDWDPNGSYIYCSNHTSYLDIVLIYCLFPKYFVFMGKHELRKIPLFGIFFKDMDIAVDRSSNMGSHRAFKRAGQDIDKGHSVVIFPEGTIPPAVPQLMRFKNGPFKLAIEKQIPIVPITFLNNYTILPHEQSLKLYGGPGIARVVIHKPVNTAGMGENDLVPLREHVFDIINQTMNGDENR